MFRKLAVLAVLTVTALALLPAVSASAKTDVGRYIGCYGIKKKGNYNRVRVGLFGDESSGHHVSAHTNLSVSRDCQRVNSLPVIELRIYSAQLKGASGHIYARAGGTATSHKGIIYANTKSATVPCGHLVRAQFKISYTYYDNARVHPFWVHGKYFYAC